MSSTIHDSTVLFVSHSKKDATLARKVVDLLRAGLTVPASAIRCSSLEEHTIRAGDGISDRLRDDLHQSSVVIGVFTKYSIDSTWALMELGAAWVLGKPMIPLLAPGVAPRHVPGPFMNLRALKMYDAVDMRGFINAVAEHANVTQTEDEENVDAALTALGRHMHVRIQRRRNAANDPRASDQGFADRAMSSVGEAVGIGQKIVDAGWSLLRRP